MSFGEPGWSVHPWVMGRDEAMPFFRRAREAGINFLDTADFYSKGASEQITGEAVRTYFRRDETVVATKIGLQMGEGPNLSGLSRKHILEGVDASLKRLGLDHVVRQGKVTYLGASSMWTWQFAALRALQRENGLAQFAAMQNFYNLAYREEEREMMPYCASEGVAVVPWSPIARGFLAGNRPKEGAATERARTDRMSEGYFGTRQDYAILNRVEKAATRLGVTPAQVAYAWILSKPFVTAPIVGTTKLGQLDEAVSALDVELDERTIKALEAPYRPRAVMGHE